MGEGMLGALLSLLGTLAGAFAGILVANRLLNYRLTQLEGQVERYRDIAEHLAEARRRLDGLEAELKTVFLRLEEFSMLELEEE